jgi:hypothetical protein
MSTGSNNIIVQVTDGVDANIAPKIRDIGSAARDSANNLTQLQNALNAVTGNAAKLNQTVNSVSSVLNSTAGSTSRLQGALTQLVARVVGAEAGFGMLGGALGRVGVAAGVAGPLLIGALAVGAIAGAILIYEKFEAAARKLTDAQIALASQFAQQHTRLLEQKEDLIGLTEGPMAKYAAQLRDLSQKEIVVNIANINKVLTDQESKWASIVSFVERYASLIGTIASPAPFTIQNSIDFIKQTELARVSSTNQLKGLQDALQATGEKLNALHQLEQTQAGRTLTITEVSRKGIQDYYNTLLGDYQAYLNEKKKLQLGEAGLFLAEQRKESEEELRAFNEQLSNLKNASGVTSPQQTLALRQSQLEQFDREHPGDTNQASPFAATRDTLVKDIGNAQEAIDRQDRSLNQLIQHYKDEVQGSQNYSVALRTEIEQRRAAAEVTKLAPDNANSKTALETIDALIAAKVRDAEISKEQTAIYNEFVGPVLKYNAAIEASNRLLATREITANQAAIAQAAASRAEQDALNPLNEYVIGLQHEIELLGTYGTALAVATEVDRVRQELQRQGRDLTKEQTDSLTQFLTQLEHARTLQQDINSLYEQNAGAIEKLVIQQTALNQARNKGVISDTQYKVANAQINVELANQALLASKNATLQNQLVSALGHITQGYQGLAKGLADAYGDALKTLDDGIANSLGRAIAYGENLGKTLKDVAREVVSGLLSAFIKLGIQFLINEAISKSVAAAALAETLALANVVATAWAPAAAFASLASFGANAAPASAAVSGTVALTEALAAATGKFAQGGLVTGGSGLRDDVPALLTGGEYVINARATAQHRALLEQINSGASNIRSNAPIASVGNHVVQVQVIHDGSTAVQVKQMDDGRVRVIAKSVVEEHAPKVVAAELQNPNSHASKGVMQNFDVKRKR